MIKLYCWVCHRLTNHAVIGQSGRCIYCNSFNHQPIDDKD